MLLSIHMKPKQNLSGVLQVILIWKYKTKNYSDKYFSIIFSDKTFLKRDYVSKIPIVIEVFFKTLSNIASFVFLLWWSGFEPDLPYIMKVLTNRAKLTRTSTIASFIMKHIFSKFVHVKRILHIFYETYILNVFLRKCILNIET